MQSNSTNPIPRCAVLAAMVAILTILVLAAAGQQSPTAKDGPALQERYPRYRLRPGDVMELTFPFTPEFNQTVAVQPDGFINLQGAGDLRVQGKTTPEVVEAVRAMYAKILNNPSINLRLTQFEKPYFVISGEVTHPGKYDYTGDTTVAQAVAIAGGFTNAARKGDVLLFRRVSDDWAEVKKIDVKRMFDRQDLSEDLHLRPGDMVLVSKSKMSTLSKFIPIPSLGMYFNPIRY